MEYFFSIDEIQATAATVWETAKAHKVLAFYGRMGAGKTTFIHALCDVLQVKETVSSPTFAIINEYESPLAGIIYHMDWYRLNSEEEAIQAGVEDCLLNGNLSMVEWPEKAALLLPPGTLHIYIEALEGEPQLRRSH